MTTGVSTFRRLLLGRTTGRWSFAAGLVAAVGLSVGRALVSGLPLGAPSRCDWHLDALCRGDGCACAGGVVGAGR